MIVDDSGNEHAGKWRAVVHNVAADFKTVFGAPLPRVLGIALGADTDNSSDQVETFFGDFRFESRL